MKIFLGIIALIIGAYVMHKLESWYRKDEIESAFSGRESHTPEQFYELYYKEKGVPFYIERGISQLEWQSPSIKYFSLLISRLKI